VCFLEPPSPPARRREEAVGARSDADSDELEGRCVRAPPPCVGERGEAAVEEVEEAARCVRAPIKG
tara:strand:+ start:1480 stop:1677 length:198 start_codon:yes stop_codon:yes gene_type:complete